MPSCARSRAHGELTRCCRPAQAARLSAGGPWFLGAGWVSSLANWALWVFSKFSHCLGHVLAQDDHAQEGEWPKAPVQSRIVPAPPTWRSESRMLAFVLL